MYFVHRIGLLVFWSFYGFRATLMVLEVLEYFW